MVEAFPSAFLGVLLPDSVISGLPSKRGGKSDRLYEACLTEGVFEQLVPNWNGQSVKRSHCLPQSGTMTGERPTFAF